MKNYKAYFKPFYIVRKLSNMGLLNIIPDKAYLKLIFWARFNKRLNLKNPKTYNEKIQWMKLYDRDERYVTLADKYLVRDYVERLIGSDYLIPLIGVWNSPNEIDYKALPNKFVLKCNHDSGSVVICDDKSKFDYLSATKKLNSCLERGTYYYGREWPYKNIQKCVIAEELISQGVDDLFDYKFFCFDGKVQCLFVASGRQKDSEVCFDFFDRDFNHLDVKNGHPLASVTPKKPDNFDKMIEIAETLSSGFRHVRIDLYNVNGKIHFGEYTFFHHSGLTPFIPYSFDEKLGEYIEL